MELSEYHTQQIKYLNERFDCPVCKQRTTANAHQRAKGMCAHCEWVAVGICTPEQPF